MSIRHSLSILLPALACLTLLASTGRALGQSGEPTAIPSAGGVISGIGHSLGSMFSALLTPYQPPLALTAFDGIEQTRTADGGFLLGDPDAPITLVEFADWGCPHCDAYKPVMDQFIDSYVRTGQASYELRILPTAGGELTVVAARLAECADDQQPGAFWALSERFYALAENGQYTPVAFGRLVDGLKLDQAALQGCIGSAPQVRIDSEYATLLNVTGTPAVLIRRGDELPSFIRHSGQVYRAGGVPFDVLQFVMEGGGGDDSLKVEQLLPVSAL